MSSKPKKQNEPGKQPLRLEYVEARTLTPNPANWRLHSKKQLAAISGVIKDEEVGWAGALLFNERTGRLVDGHGRLKTVKPTDAVPVLIGSWSEKAEKKILLTLDPIGAMATADGEAMQQLIKEIDLSDRAFEGLSGELDAMLKSVEPETTDVSANGDDGPGDAEPSAEANAPRADGTGGNRFRIILDFDSEQQQAKYLKRFQKEKLRCRALEGMKMPAIRWAAME